MKKNQRLVSTLLLSALSLTVISITSCNDSKEVDSKKVAQDQNDAKFKDKKVEKDADFLVEAAAINREEISLGQLAQQKGKSVCVKKLGKMIEDAHTKSLSDVTALAQIKAVTLPSTQTAAEKEAYTKLNEKSNNDFDQAYTDRMVDGHKDAISKFEKAAEKATDAEIKTWANNTLPDLRTHLEHAEQCKKEIEK